MPIGVIRWFLYIIIVRLSEQYDNISPGKPTMSTSDTEIANDETSTPLEYYCGWCNVLLDNDDMYIHRYLKNSDYCSYDCLQMAMRRFGGHYKPNYEIYTKRTKMTGDQLNNVIDNVKTDLQNLVKNKYVEVSIKVME